jgi:hypothetical protein
MVKQYHKPIGQYFCQKFRWSELGKIRSKMALKRSVTNRPNEIIEWQTVVANGQFSNFDRKY